MMLAGELALAGIDVAIVERRASQDLDGMRAGGLHSRTIEVLDQRGIADRFLSQGRMHPAVSFNMIPLDISDFPTRHNYVLALQQNHIERILASWVDELAVPIYRGREVTGFAQDDTGVDVRLSDGQSLRAAYLVGCDGGRSLIRKAAGIEFPGWDPTTSWLIAEVECSEEPAWGFRHDALGTHALGKLENEKQVRVLLMEQPPRPSRERTLRDVSEALVAIYGTDYGIHSPTWISSFTDMTRQAAAYRDRRVLLAGDAAHVHPPVGGQGLNICVQDAVNLSWKLAGGKRDITGKSSGHVPRRAPPGGCPRAAHHDGANGAAPARRPHEGLERHHVRVPQHGRASQTTGRRAVWSGRSLRPRQGTPAAGTPHAQSRPGHRRRPAAVIHSAARSAPGATQPW
jgi:3-(3-hydroxy-phenyl)propionate hydroxylase